MATAPMKQTWPDIVWLASPPLWFGRRTRPRAEPRIYADATDAELMGWSGNDDRRAFDEIVARHGPFALRVARRLIADPLAVEDVVQDAMVRAWTQAGRFDPTRARFGTWLYQIVVNRCIDYRRRVTPDQLPEGFDLADPALGADATIEANERQAAILAALRLLPANQRAAMTLVYDEGLSGAEAARVLGVSVKAVERLIARARAQLREHVQPARFL